jgi:hypothetical protein
MIPVQEPTHQDLETIADLEIFGLRPRTASLLETAGWLFISDFKSITEEQLYSISNISVTTVQEIRNALVRYCTGVRIKTVRQCVEFPEKHARRKRRKV